MLPRMMILMILMDDDFDDFDDDDDDDDFDDDDDDDDATCGPGVPRIYPASSINTLTTASHLPCLQL